MYRTYAKAGTTLAMLMAASSGLHGQAAAPVTPAAAEEGEEETIVLSPFVVEAQEDANSYRASATLAGTRIRTELRDVGSAVSVVTPQFLQDTGARNTQDLLVYTANTEVGGLSGNFVGAGTGAIIDTAASRSRPQNNTRVRGLTNADNTRDFFLTDIPWDSYIVGRIDLQRGPNAILFGIGSPAGIVNASVNGAAFKDENTVEFRYGRFGSYRGSLDFNRVLLKDELAIRVAGLNDKTFYRQDPAYNHDTRVFGALRYDPKFLMKNGARTSFKFNYEDGSIDANRPRVIPPVDAITPWFNSMNKATYNATDMGRGNPEDILGPDLVAGTSDDRPLVGAIQTQLANSFGPNPYYQPWIDGGAGGQVFDQPIAIFPNPNDAAPSNFIEGSLQTNGLPSSVTFPWSVYRGIQPYNVYAQRAGLPNNGIGAYKAYTLSDRGVFDFYEELIDGPNKSEIEDFRVLNATLSQTFLDNKVGFEFAYDRQDYYQEQNQLIPNPFLTVDVMSHLPDGSANPNVGRAMVIGAPNSNNSRSSDREAFRLTGFAELDFKDLMSESKLRSFLGRHVFTGLYMEQQQDQEDLAWYSYVATRDYRPLYSQSLDSLRIPSLHYLTGDLRNVGLGGFRVGNLNATQVVSSGTIRAFNSALRPGATEPYTADSIVGWEDINFNVRNGAGGVDRSQLYSRADKVRDEIDSQAFIWQGFFLDGVIVPMVGWRKDVARNYNAGIAPTNADQSRRPWDPEWTLPTGPDDERITETSSVKYNKETGESVSWSLVVKTPRSIKARMPLESDISFFYNESDNFQPAGGRTNVFGGSIASPKGETKDYGFTITTLNDRLSLKVNWYETKVTNANLGSNRLGDLSNVYMVGFGEHWGRMFANWATLGIEGFNQNYALVDPAAPESGANPRIDPNVALLRYQPAPGQSVADALAAQNAAISTLLANPPPANFASHWTIALNQDWSAGWGGYQGPQEPASLAVTGDTTSKGVEFELTAQPTKNWNIAINASKVTASRSNLAESFAVWVEDRKVLYDGPAGDVRLWGPGYGGETVRSKWMNEFYGSYLLYRLLEGSDVPELRPWRFNLVTNYTFDRGALRGVNIGGGYRWQDRSITGFRVVNNTYDINSPYMGPTETAIDFWVGYQRRITKNLDWRIQVNVRNAFGDTDLIPLTVQPDGSVAAARIPEPMVWTVSNTFKF